MIFNERMRRFAGAVCAAAVMAAGTAGCSEPFVPVPDAADGAGDSTLVTSISAADVPNGWAGFTGTVSPAGTSTTAPANYGGKGGTVFTVTNRAGLKSALSSGTARIIYISGMIDMTDEGDGAGSKLPTSADGTTAALDAFIKTTTAGTTYPAATYSEWKTIYGQNVVSTQDQPKKVVPSGTKAEEVPDLKGDIQVKLYKAWRTVIEIKPKSNTTIIGKDANSGIKGGTIQISSVSNVVIRNIIIQDAYDPFPEMEGGDGLNAEWDGVCVQNSSYIWIDRCTFRSTMTNLSYVTTSDGVSTKWQTYDGLCDIKAQSKYITASWCVFENNDKTSLFGSSDSDTAERTITYHHNWFKNCTQRLPMVRHTYLHLYNNYYSGVGSYAVGKRMGCKIYSQGNYFESSSTSVGGNNGDGVLYDTGTSTNINRSWCNKKTEWMPLDYYSYGADTAADAKTKVMASAGAGKVSVSQ